MSSWTLQTRVVLAAWRCSNLLLPKCRCPSSARAWSRLLVASLCARSDKKLHTGLCLSGENPRARFPNPTHRRASRATWALGLMCHSPRVASWSPRLVIVLRICSMGRAPPPPPPPPPPTSAAQVSHRELYVELLMNSKGNKGQMSAF